MLYHSDQPPWFPQCWGVPQDKGLLALNLGKSRQAGTAGLPSGLNLIMRKYQTYPNWVTVYNWPVVVFQNVKDMKDKGRLRNCPRFKETRDMTTKTVWDPGENRGWGWGGRGKGNWEWGVMLLNNWQNLNINHGLNICILSILNVP